MQYHRSIDESSSSLPLLLRRLLLLLDVGVVPVLEELELVLLGPELLGLLETKVDKLQSL